MNDIWNYLKYSSFPLNILIAQPSIEPIFSYMWGD